MITPVFNEQRYLPAMLDSVRAQTHSDWELLLVDDGSTDDTPTLVAAAAADDPRIRVVSSGTKLGKVAAFNAAYAAARGDIVCHVGGDDELVPAALRLRVDALGPHVGERAVAFFKILIVDEARGTETVHPRGAGGNMSGPSITMTRPLADLVFPVPPELPSEDIWMGNLAAALADRRIDSTDVVIRYRVHAGNSNPRAKSFAQMSEAMHVRSRAFPRMLAEPRFDLPATARAQFEQQWRAEQLRRDGRVLALLTDRQLPLVERLAYASMANPPLWFARQKLAHRAGGWRGR
nr:glycosyltransferase family A protein [Kineosphaera limosa]